MALIVETLSGSVMKPTSRCTPAVASSSPATAAGRRQHQALDQQLTHDAAARRAERQPQRHLALTRGAARQQQIRDVRARNQQHAGDDRHQHPQRPPQLSAHRRIPSRRGHDVDLVLVQVAPLRRRGGAAEARVGQILLAQRAIERREARFRLFRRDAGLQPRDTPSASAARAPACASRAASSALPSSPARTPASCSRDSSRRSRVRARQ